MMPTHALNLCVENWRWRVNWCLDDHITGSLSRADLVFLGLHSAVPNILSYMEARDCIYFRKHWVSNPMNCVIVFPARLPYEISPWAKPFLPRRFYPATFQFPWASLNTHILAPKNFCLVASGGESSTCLIFGFVFVFFLSLGCLPSTVPEWQALSSASGFNLIK